MSKPRSFFTAELGKRLKSLRCRQGMTLADVAERLDLRAGSGRGVICRLEQGQVPDPHLSTIARYLIAVGAGWSEIDDLLDWIEPLAVPPKPVEKAQIDPGRKAEVQQCIEEDVHQYQRRIARPQAAPPLLPKVQRRASEKYRDYVILARIVRQAIQDYLTTTRVGIYDYEKYQGYGRRILGALRRFTGEKQAARLAAVEDYARANQFDSKVCAGVRGLVQLVLEHLAGDAGELSRRRQEQAQEAERRHTAELRLEVLRPRVAAREDQIVKEANVLILPFTRQQPVFTGASYLKAVSAFTECWLNTAVAVEPGSPGFGSRLRTALDEASGQFKPEVYDANLLRQLREIVVRNLTGLSAK